MARYRRGEGRRAAAPAGPAASRGRSICQRRDPVFPGLPSASTDGDGDGDGDGDTAATAALLSPSAPDFTEPGAAPAAPRRHAHNSGRREGRGGGDDDLVMCSARGAGQCVPCPDRTPGLDGWLP